MSLKQQLATQSYTYQVFALFPVQIYELQLQMHMFNLMSNDFKSMSLKTIELMTPQALLSSVVYMDLSEKT